MVELSKEEGLKIIDITGKKISFRRAVAKGDIILRDETIKAIKDNNVAKGDVLTVAKTSAIIAVKKTPELIPGCHPIPLTHIGVDFKIEENRITAVCEVSSESKTGVEMEALTGVAMALLTIWDMVKEIEKDDKGQYPDTSIGNIRVVEKVKKE
ncbi:MAG: cyclic pyranopterin monophosphate synthase MoaC [Thermoproteota archaeon]